MIPTTPLYPPIPDYSQSLNPPSELLFHSEETTRNGYCPICLVVCPENLCGFLSARAGKL